jgi:hydrogenase maturation protease
MTHAGAGPRRRILVGLGHPDRGDDAVGQAVCDAFGDRDDVTVWPVAGDPCLLAARWEPDDRVVVVDAVVSGAPPGTVHVVHVGTTGPDRIAAGTGTLSSHGFGLADAIALSRAIGTLPRELVVVGVEIVGVDRGAGLSDPVTDAVAAAVGAAEQELSAPGW